MPTPNPNENKEDFIQRCIPIVMRDGAAQDNAQAYAICSSMYDNRDKDKTNIPASWRRKKAKKK